MVINSIFVRKECLTNGGKGVMEARDFLVDNLPYAIINENGKWIVKNGNNEVIGECHLPSTVINKAAYKKGVNDQSKVNAIYLYDRNRVPSLKEIPSKEDEEQWKDYCSRLKILCSTMEVRKKQKKISISR